MTLEIHGSTGCVLMPALTSECFDFHFSAKNYKKSQSQKIRKKILKNRNFLLKSDKRDKLLSFLIVNYLYCVCEVCYGQVGNMRQLEERSVDGVIRYVNHKNNPM